MILDTSALIAILRQEPEAERFAKAIEMDPEPKISAANYVEAAAVVYAARDARASRELDQLLSVAAVELSPVTARQAKLASEAYRDFGRGSGHPARLNFGDCFAYALAKDLGEPLLFKGTDFAKTDVEVA